MDLFRQGLDRNEEQANLILSGHTRSRERDLDAINAVRLFQRVEQNDAAMFLGIADSRAKQATDASARQGLSWPQGSHLQAMYALLRCGASGFVVLMRWSSRFKIHSEDHKMKMTGNTILITGGGTGIGRGLAEAFQQQSNQVIIAGRRHSVLEETVHANPGMQSFTVDVTDAGDVERLRTIVSAEFPTLNVLINGAGIMKSENLKAGIEDLDIAEQTVDINFLGTLRLTAALMPLLLAQPKATIMTVSSGLAFLPIHPNPSYCATKAAIHSWTQSLRYQLRDTAVEVLEIAPPYVQTELTGRFQAEDPNAMPLVDYIRETMSLLKDPPPSGEILVERVRSRRFAEQTGDYEKFYAQWNEYAAQRAVERAAKGF